MSETLTFEQAITYLRKQGYILNEASTSTYRCGEKIQLNCFKIEDGKVMNWRREIYDRRQYTEDGPQVGLFIDSYGMSYGGQGANYRISDMPTLREKLYL